MKLIIDKALKEEDPEKKAGFANSIAYYMKLAYSNWHKELVHDDAIRSELNKITGGELEFSNTPYIKHRNQNFEHDDYRSNNTGRRQNFGSRNNNNNRDNRNRSTNGGRNNRGDNRNRIIIITTAPITATRASRKGLNNLFLYKRNSEFVLKTGLLFACFHVKPFV